MFIELRNIEIGENWFNNNSEETVVVDDVYLEKGEVQVDYTYLNLEHELIPCTASLNYFTKEYQRLPYSIEEGYNYENIKQ